MRILKAIVDEIETTDSREFPEYVEILDDLDDFIKLNDQK